MRTDPGTPRWLLLAGIGLVAIGAVVFAVFVLPHIAAGQFSATPPHAGDPAIVGRTAGLTMAVLVAGTGLAAGFALIGIGLGHWRRPRPSVDGREV